MGQAAEHPNVIGDADFDEFPMGSYEDGLTMVGTRTVPVRAEVPVELGLVKAYAALLEDPNPALWDAEASAEIWGGQIAQAGLVTALFLPLRWQPYPRPVTNLGAKVPLPGTTIINVRTEQIFYRPLMVGDWLTVEEDVVSVSPPKETKLGVGNFIVTAQHFTDDAGELVADNINTVLRFTPAEES